MWCQVSPCKLLSGLQNMHVLPLEAFHSLHNSPVCGH
jgi:hypothetical protein